MTPTVTVALATYNGEPFIREQLDSLERQSRHPAELVVCDDASTDRTVEFVRAFADRASFPVSIHVNAERLGWRGNFMKAAGLCASELIALCDQDDVWYPEKIGTMCAEFDDPDVVLAHHGADLIDAAGARIGAMPTASFRLARTPPLTRHTTWPNPFGLTIVFRRSLLRYIDLWSDPAHYYAPGKPFPHDQWLFNFAISVGTVSWVDTPLVGYRQHAANAIGWTDKGDVPKAAPVSDEIVAKVDAGLRVLVPFTRAFGEAAASATGTDAARLREAVRRNTTLAARLRVRRALHTRKPLPRIVTLARMLASGAYKGGRGWTLGKEALLEDLRAAFGTTAHPPGTT